jgi:outer membrane protein TolC
MKWRLALILSSLVIIPFSINAQSIHTLDYYIVSAKENSPVLNDYNNQRYILKIDSLIMRSEYGLKITAAADMLYAPIIRDWGYDAALSNGQNVSAIVRISKDLLGKTNLNTRLSNLSLTIKQILNQGKISELQLNRTITEQYINTYALQLQYQNSQEIIKLLNEEGIILKRLTQSSAFKQTDYLSFMVILQQNLLTSQQIYADWLNNYATLNYLSGIVDTTLQKIEPPLFPDRDVVPFSQSIYAENYKTDSLKLANDAKIVVYEYRPKLTAYVDGGYSSSIATTPYKNFGTSVGVALTVPIYDGGKQKKLLQQKQVQQDTRRKYNEFEINQYTQQTVQIEQQIKEYKQIITTANEQLKYAQILIDANLKQLPTGDVKLADFILSINNYINLKSGLIQFETILYNLYNRLNNLIIQ